MKFRKTLALAAVLSAAIPMTAYAIDTSQPIRIVVAHPAGSVTDIASRIIAEALTTELDQPVFVENRTGGDGTIGMLEVVKAAPDGNTIFAGGFGGQLIPPLMKKDFPIDVNTQLTKIARPTEFANILVINADLPVKSVGELIDYAKAHPGEVNWGASGTATSSRLTGEMFIQKTDAPMTRVPYAGSPAAINDLATGVIQVIFANLPTVVGLIDAGELRALAVTSPYRLPQLPDVPTMIESGIPDFAVTSWNSFFGPAGMDPKDVKTLSDAIVKVVQEPKVGESLRQVGFEPVPEGSEDFAKFFDAQVALWKPVLEKAELIQK